MVDTFRVTRASGPPVLDEETGQNVPSLVTIFEGVGRLRLPRAFGNRVDEQGAAVTVQDATLSLPIADSAGVAVDDVVELLTSENDPGMVGLRLRVTEVHWQSYSTARRFGVEVEA